MSLPTGYSQLNDERHVSLCETLDRVLNTGVVVAGDAVISVADIDLIYLNLRLMLSSVETIRQQRMGAPALAHLPGEVEV
jgi:uncharacterized phosphosugar-binding protein